VHILVDDLNALTAMTTAACLLNVLFLQDSWVPRQSIDEKILHVIEGIQI